MSERMDNIFVTGPISVTKIAEIIANHQNKKNIGAHSIFLGQVRADDLENGKVDAINYTAYPEMALEVAHKIREDLFAKYDLTCAHLLHSLGAVKAGEICLMVFTSSKHRKVAINACEEWVERIKKELPIWGKEQIPGAESVWKENLYENG